jgi:hypothetical protein
MMAVRNVDRLIFGTDIAPGARINPKHYLSCLLVGIFDLPFPKISVTASEMEFWMMVGRLTAK